MKAIQFIQEASRTESKVGDFHVQESAGYNSRVVHALMGLAGESGEILDSLKKSFFYNKPIDADHLTEECGDLMWYLVILCDVYKIDLNIAVERVRSLKECEMTISWQDGNGQIVNLDSRLFLKPFELQKTVGEIIDVALSVPLVYNHNGMRLLVYDFVDVIDSLLRALHVDIETVMEKNVAKLKTRYPEKFTDENAVNRDPAKEKQAMDGVK